MTFLADWFRNKNGELETIYVIIVRKEDAVTPTKAQKEVKETKKETKKESKSRPTLKVKIEPGVGKKRSFSITSIKPEPEEIPAIKKEKEESKSPLDLPSPSVLLFRDEEDRVDFRTRKRLFNLRILNALQNSGQFNCCSLLCTGFACSIACSIAVRG